MAETTLRLQSKNLMKSMLYIFLKLINHSWGQKPTKEAYLGHMHEPWYPINTQLKILWVLIWDQTWFWFQINHLRSNQHFSIINTLLTTIPKMNWILFDIINFDSIGYHKLFHKRSSVDIPSRLLGHLHHKLAKPVIQGCCIHFFNAGRTLCVLE